MAALPAPMYVPQEATTTSALVTSVRTTMSVQPFTLAASTFWVKLTPASVET